MKGPLDGIQVADFSRILAGPLCTMMLADAGADVIKIESPEGDETRRWGPPFSQGESAYFLAINRNKRSVMLDLKSVEGQKEADDLIRRSDVVVENFLPVQQKRLSISPEKTRSINPQAIHCGIRGYDADSPRSDDPGFDLLAQACSGLMSITGPVEGPPTKVGVALADVLTAHWAHGAILSTLLEREKSGEGGVVEVSLFGSTVASLINVAQSFLLTNRPAARWGNQHPSIAPYQPFRTADGWVAVGATSQAQFESLCEEVLEIPSLIGDSRYRSNEERVRHRDELVGDLEPLFLDQPTSHWLDRCRHAGVPAAPVADIASVLSNDDAPVVKGTHPAIGELTMVRNPIRRNGIYQTSFDPPPRLGEHQYLIDEKRSNGRSDGG